MSTNRAVMELQLMALLVHLSNTSFPQAFSLAVDTRSGPPPRFSANSSPWALNIVNFITGGGRQEPKQIPVVDGYRQSIPGGTPLNGMRRIAWPLAKVITDGEF